MVLISVIGLGLLTGGLTSLQSTSGNASLTRYLVIGVVGALLGGVFIPLLKIYPHHFFLDLMMALLGAALALTLLKKL